MNIICYDSKSDSIYEVELDKIKRLFEDSIDEYLNKGFFFDLGDYFLIYGKDKTIVKNKYIEVFNRNINAINNKIILLQKEIVDLESDKDEIENNIEKIKLKLY